MIEEIVDEDIEGALIETGTWRGGTCIFMSGVLFAYEKLKGKESDRRRVIGFDSFEGFLPEGIDETLDTYLSKDVYTAQLEAAQASSERISKDLIFPNTLEFIKGQFSSTLCCISQPIALLRLDGDLYSSTMIALEQLYPQVSSGGWVIVDDYNWRPPRNKDSKAKLCRHAVDEYRANFSISAPLCRHPPSWRA